MCRILDQITRINKPKMSQEFWQNIKEKLFKKRSSEAIVVAERAHVGGQQWTSGRLSAS